MEDKIRLERIQVKGLFNRFTFDIGFENRHNVAILIGPNGLGKTTIFNLINYIFSPSVINHDQIDKIPFEKCVCTLSNGKKVSLERRNDDKGKELIVTIDDGKTQPEFNLSNVISKWDREPYAEDMPEEYADHIFAQMIRDGIIPEYGLKRRRNRADRRMSALRRAFGDYSDFLDKNDCSLKVDFIAADRLHKPISRRFLEGKEREEDDPLEEIQIKLRQLHVGLNNVFNSLVSEKRDELPKMYLDKSQKDVPDFETFEKGWKEYVEDIEKFKEIGLLPPSQTTLEIEDLEEAYKANGAFLSVYLEAFKDTLRPWREQYERMRLFVDILTKRNQVTSKEFKYSFFPPIAKGLKVTAYGDELPIECLSSGEKNDLIMFYNLIFESEEGDLVLIDEPEISWHIVWQEEFLDYLLKICEMNGLQAIVATHSPHIINGRLELYAKRGLTDELKTR